MKMVEFANNIDPDEVPHNEPSHLDLHCLSILLAFYNMLSPYDIAWAKLF